MKYNLLIDIPSHTMVACAYRCCHGLSNIIVIYKEGSVFTFNVFSNDIKVEKM